MTGLSRCPFCHASVDFAAAAWVACAGCLARHHASCWEESRVCSSCGDPRPLAAAEKGTRSRRPWGVAAGILIAVAAQLPQLIHQAHLAWRIEACRDLWISDSAATAQRLADLESKVSEARRSMDDARVRPRLADLETQVARLVGEDEETPRWGISHSGPENSVPFNAQLLDALVAGHRRLAANLDQLRRDFDRCPDVVDNLRALSGLAVRSPADMDEILAMLAQLSSEELRSARTGVLSGGIRKDDVADLARFAAARKRDKLTQNEFDRVKGVILAKR